MSRKFSNLSKEEIATLELLEWLKDYYSAIILVANAVANFNRVYPLRKNLSEKTPNPRSVTVLADYNHGSLSTLDQKVAESKKNCYDAFKCLRNAALSIGQSLTDDDRRTVLNGFHIRPSLRDSVKARAENALKTVNLGAPKVVYIQTMWNDYLRRSEKLTRAKRKKSETRTSSHL